MSRVISLPEPWATLARALGGVGALAEALDVEPRTVHRWATGARVPDELRKRDVRARLKRRGLEPPW